MEVQVPITNGMVDEVAEAPLSPETQSLLGSLGAGAQLPEAPVDYATLAEINLADDANLIAFVDSDVIPLISATRNGRQSREEEWLEIDRMDQFIHDSNQKYIGESDVYLPVANNNFNTIVSLLQRGLFPSDDYFEVASVSDVPEDSETAKVIKLYAQWELETSARLKFYSKPFLRQLVKYGTGVLKWMWRHGPTNGCNQPGFAVSPRNLFNWYIYPESADSIEQAVMVFEDVDMPRHELERMGRLGRWLNVEDALATPKKQTYQEADRLAQREGTETSAGSNLAQMFRITEVWTYAKLPAKARKSTEHEDDQIIVQIMLCGTTLLEIRRHPYEYAKIPYEVARVEWEAGDFYGKAFGKRVQPFQYLANDFANQTNDNGIYALNPFAIMNPSFLAGTPPPLAPGVVLYATDVEQAVKFERPPAEQVGVGMSMMQFYLSQGQSQGGAPPVLQGGKADKTATGTQILQNNAISPIQDLVEDIEVSAMVPTIRAWWHLQKQFRKAEVTGVITGQAFKMDPAKMKLNADFRWLASSQAVSRSQRAQQATVMLQTITNPAILQALAQHGKTVNPEPLMQKIYNDGLGFRGFDKIIVPLPMPVAPGMPPGAPGAEGPTAPPPGDRVRSFTEQANGTDAPPEMALGEGEEGMSVRDNADQLAAEQGGGTY